MNLFQGCDFTNSAANVDDHKSPNCVNMVRDVPGKIRKSMGYKTVTTYPGKINGSHYLRARDEQLIHAGTKLYHNNVLIYDGMADERSRAWQFGEKLYIQDGKQLLMHECVKAEEGWTYGSHDFNVKSGFTWKINVKNNDVIHVQCEITMTHCSIDETEGTIVVNEDGSSYCDITVIVGGETTLYVDVESKSQTIKTWDDHIEADLGTGFEATFSVDTDRYETLIITKVDKDGNTISDINKNFIGTFPFRDDESGIDYKYYLYPCTGSMNVTEKKYSTATNLQDDYDVQNVYTPVEVYVSASSSISSVVHTFPNGKTENVPVSSREIHLIFNEPGNHTITYKASGTVRKTVYYFRNYSGEYELRLDYSGGTQGKMNVTIGRRPVGGFINDLDNEYVEEDGYMRKVSKVSDIAYIPTVTIAKDPRGGGESYEALNLIQPAFIELFQGSYMDGTSEVAPRTFQLSFKGLDTTEVKAWVLNSDADWIEKKEGKDFSVNRQTGVVTFTSAPGSSPITGEDNVKIQAYRTVEGYADRINKCTISTLFGVNGNADRMFVSGNPDFINYDWYSGQYDPTYFPDTGYSVLGSSSSAIVGYSIISNYLAAHKDDQERDMNIILREGNLVDDEPSFPVVATLQGAGAVAPWSFGYLATEPIFLTKRGVYAVTAQDITGEKYSQNRSYYIDGKLLEEPNLEKAYACIYNDFYILSLNGKFYILDGLQPIQTDKSMPYATRQYACFYRENVPATCVWVFNDVLHFGTADGRICTFYKDKNDLYSYNDDGEAIPCVWETPDLDGRYFFKNKTFRYIAIRLDSAIATSINIYTMKRGIWNHAKTDSTKGRYFTFPYLNFEKFSFSTDTTQKIVHTKLRLKKVDKARFRFTNTEINEPFGIYDVALEYIENGNYKN